MIAIVYNLWEDHQTSANYYATWDAAKTKTRVLYDIGVQFHHFVGEPELPTAPRDALDSSSLKMYSTFPRIDGIQILILYNWILHSNAPKMRASIINVSQRHEHHYVRIHRCAHPYLQQNNDYDKRCTPSRSRIIANNHPCHAKLAPNTIIVWEMVSQPFAPFRIQRFPSWCRFRICHMFYIVLSHGLQLQRKVPNNPSRLKCRRRRPYLHSWAPHMTKKTLIDRMKMFRPNENGGNAGNCLENTIKTMLLFDMVFFHMPTSEARASHRYPKVTRRATRWSRR